MKTVGEPNPAPRKRKGAPFLAAFQALARRTDVRVFRQFALVLNGE